MTALNLTAVPQIAEVLSVAAWLTLTERLLVARFLLDSVLTNEIDEDADWQRSGLQAFETDRDNEEDAIDDNWREIYGIPAW